MESGEWPKSRVSWIKLRTLYISIPFTWELPVVRRELLQKSLEWDRVVVGGPAVYLMPDYYADLSFVKIGDSYPGILQFINPLATRTTTGCFRKCKFCGVPRFEGKLQELDDWPDLPVICDNNLLGASIDHFDKVINRLKKHVNVDFNQGLDSRLLTKYHAKRISEIKGIKQRGLRLALDGMSYSDSWLIALDKLRSAGIAKRKISSYAIIGFDSDPAEAWSRCEWIEKKGVRVLPMWFHELDQLEKNIVTEKQEKLGWSDFERRKIMQWYYQHKRAVKAA